jgi:hypothetical protein
LIRKLQPHNGDIDGVWMHHKDVPSNMERKKKHNTAHMLRRKTRKKRTRNQDKDDDESSMSSDEEDDEVLEDLQCRFDADSLHLRRHE